MITVKNKHIFKLLFFDMFVIEFGPVGIFFLTYYFTDFITAALALGIATLLTMVLSQLVNKRLPWFAIFSGTVTIITSFVTYIYTAPWVLIVKDSVYYALFASILGFSLWRKYGVFKTFFSHVFAMNDKGWRLLEFRWFLFLLLAALSNEAVRMYLSVEQWIVYKQVLLIIFFIFGMYQLRITMKYRTEEADRLGFRKRLSK